MLKKLLLISVLACGSALPAFADAVSDQVVANLKAQGFDVVQMDRTWLGRMWILARNDQVQREVVFNPVTGEILRDYTVLLATLRDPGDGGSDIAVVSSDGPVQPPSVVQRPPETAAGAPGLSEEDQVSAAPINPVQ